MELGLEIRLRRFCGGFGDKRCLQVLLERLRLCAATRQKSDEALNQRFLDRPEIPPKEISKSKGARAI